MRKNEPTSSVPTSHPAPPPPAVAAPPAPAPVAVAPAPAPIHVDPTQIPGPVPAAVDPTQAPVPVAPIPVAVAPQPVVHTPAPAPAPAPAPMSPPPPSIADAVGAGPTAPQGLTGFEDLLSSLDLSNASVGFGPVRLLDITRATTAEVVKSELKRSTAGDPMLVLEMVVETPTEFKGERLWENVMLTPDAKGGAWKFKSLCHACDLLDPTGHHFAPKEGKGHKEFEGYIVGFMPKHEEYNGQLRNKVANNFFDPESIPAAATTPA